MSPQEKVSKALGLYIHVPFCAKPCDYCAFYKKLPTKQNIAQYINCLLKELDSIEDERAFDTIYFGGGTPGILAPREIERLADAIAKKLYKIPIEWTVELAPSTVNAKNLNAWKAAGVSRISMGVQSFQPETLKSLGRHQTVQQIFSAYHLLREHSWTNVGIDLIFSAPGQTLFSLEKDLQTAIDLQPEHISTYCLSYESGTNLTRSNGDLSDDNKDSDFYEFICQFLEENGYQQYEISNFSLHGKFPSIHNINTWKMQEWIGLGPSASSQYHDQRYTNVNNLEQWVHGMYNDCPVRYDIVNLSPDMLALDEILFGLRMNQGINLCENPLHRSLLPLIGTFVDDDLALYDNGSLTLTLKGRLLCDAIESEIFNFF